MMAPITPPIERVRKRLSVFMIQFLNVKTMRPFDASRINQVK